MPSSDTGPAAAEMKMCARGCPRPVHARALCRACYLLWWKQQGVPCAASCGQTAQLRGLCERCYRKFAKTGELSRFPKLSRKTADKLSQHFDVRLKETEAAALGKLARATGKTFAKLLRESVCEYLTRLNVLQTGA